MGSDICFRNVMVLVGLLGRGEGEVEVEVADMGAETGIGVGEGLCFGK